MKTIREKVEHILSKFPKARDDDKVLLMYYWKLMDNVNMDNGAKNMFNSFMDNATAPESITRARRLIQEEGLYPASDNVTSGRNKKEKEMKASVLYGRQVI